MQSIKATDKETALRLVLSLIAELHGDGVIGIARTCFDSRYFDDTPRAGSSLPNYCRLLDTSFADTELRVDCREHESREPAVKDIV